MRLFLILLPLVVLAALSVACQPDAPEEVIESIPFREDGTLTFMRDGEALVTIAIEIAETDSSRARGLMQRTDLPDGSGMLFAFEQAEPQFFYMANTQISLDFFFVGADSTIVTTSKYARPLSLDNVTSEGRPAQYVVEVEAGFIDTHGIIEGDRVTWTRE